MRALIAGFGSIGRRHADNLRRLHPDAELQVLVPAGSASVSRLPAGVVPVHDIAEALRGRPDLALICSPSSCRLEYLLPLLEARVPCYVEKPLVATGQDVVRLENYLDGARNVPLVSVGCNLRLLPSLKRLRALLAEGAVGTVVRASFTAGQWLPDWRPGTDYRRSYSARPQAGGGVVLDLIHEIDMARWLLGEMRLVASVTGSFSRLGIEAEDTACILLEAERGAAVTISLDYVSRRRVRRYEIVGDEGTLLWDLDRATLERVDAAGSTILDASPAAFEVAATYVDALGELLLCVRQGGEPSCGIRDGLRSARLAVEARGRRAA